MSKTTECVFCGDTIVLAQRKTYLKNTEEDTLYHISCWELFNGRLISDGRLYRLLLRYYSAALRNSEFSNNFLEKKLKEWNRKHLRRGIPN